MKHVTRRDIEEVMQALDEAVRKGELRWKTATNVWGVVTRMFKDACRSKVLGLRVREDDPAREVEGPRVPALGKNCVPTWMNLGI
jgi:hypothetical protein